MYSTLKTCETFHVPERPMREQRDRSESSWRLWSCRRDHSSTTEAESGRRAFDWDGPETPAITIITSLARPRATFELYLITSCRRSFYQTLATRAPDRWHWSSLMSDVISSDGALATFPSNCHSASGSLTLTSRKQKFGFRKISTNKQSRLIHCPGNVTLASFASNLMATVIFLPLKRSQDSGRIVFW